MYNGQNVGNILVKLAMFNILRQFGLNATIITPKIYPIMKDDLSFIHRTINSNLLELKEGFSELNVSDYYYLIVNNDQPEHHMVNIFSMLISFNSLKIGKYKNLYMQHQL